MLSAFKNFGITFLVAGVVFGLIGFFVTSLLTDTVGSIIDDQEKQLENILGNSPDTSESDTDGTSTRPPESELPAGESFALLLAVTDYDPDKHNDYMPDKSAVDRLDGENSVGILGGSYRKVTASSIVLIRADRERGEYTYTPISSKTEIYASAGDITLGEAYGYYGIEYVANCVWTLTGIKPDYYLSVNTTDLDSVLSQFPSVTVEVTDSVYLADGDYGSLSFVADSAAADAPEPSPVVYPGNYAVDSELLEALARYTEFDLASHLYKMDIAAKLAEAFFTSAASLDTATLKWRIKDLAERNLIETNITDGMLDQNAELIKAVSRFGDRTLTYIGSFKDKTPSDKYGVYEDSSFVPSRSASIAFFSKYRFDRTAEEAAAQVSE